MRTLALSSLILLLIPVTSLCAVYEYVDSEGVYHITDMRPSAKIGYRVVIEDRDGPLRSAYLIRSDRNAYDELIKQHSVTNGLDPRLVKAVMIVESNGNPQAISPKGAQGLMQIMPDTAQFLDLRNPFDPGENIQAGTRYLKLLYEFFKGDLELTLAAYNAGPQTVIKNKWSVPRIAETINYIKKVKLNYGRLRDSQ